MRHPSARSFRLSALSVLLALCLLSVGCNHPKTTAPPIATGFSCAAAGTYRGEEVAGTITRTAAGLLTISLTAPEELEGLSMVWDGETVTLKLLGIEWAISPDTIPEAALGERILRTLDAVVYGESEGDSILTDDGRLKTVGSASDTATADTAAFTLYSDPESGALLSLEVPSEELTLAFSEFQITS